MVVSVSTLVHEHKNYILKQMQQVELELHPSIPGEVELVRRAIFAIRSNYISFERFIPETSTLYLNVKDVRPTNVMVNFQLENIQCSCKKEGWCRHKLSVLFSLYQHIDSLQDWLKHWRSKQMIQWKLLSSHRSPENWEKIANEVMSNILTPRTTLESNDLSMAVEKALSLLHEFLPFEREWQPIYNLFMEITILNFIWEYFESSNISIDDDDFSKFFDLRLEQIEVYVQELSGKSRLFATDPFFDELQSLVRNLLIQRTLFFEKRFHLYLIFWDKIFIEKKRAKIEQQLLLEEQSKTDIPIDKLLHVFSIILKQYDVLLNSIDSMKQDEMFIYYRLAKFAISKNNLIASQLILKRMLPFLKSFIQETLTYSQRHQFVHRIQSLYENIQLSDLEEQQLYDSFGAFGIKPYSNYLLKQKRYKEWVALHQLHPSSISYLDTMGLRQVLEEAPAVVLPLYHFYAMQEIEQKSRMHYKQAVAIWKKMKSAAKKAGKINFWTSYIQTIQLKFKRLRALQEELIKAKLIS